MIVLGSVIARGITGASSFGSAAAASAVLVVLHRLIAWVSSKNEGLESWIKGEKKLIFQNGVFFKKNMARCGISKEDIVQSLRLVSQTDDMQNVVAAWMETNGEISFILKE